MNEIPTCPRCGAVLPEDAPEGLCPRCLGALNLDAETNFTDPDRTEPFTHFRAGQAPKPEEIAPHFPQFEILECLGQGGMGVVYKARQKSLDRLVALKLLAPGREKDPQFAERFEREAHALARLSHPNIVTVHDFGVADGYYYLLMEFVDGVSLRQALGGGHFTPKQALAIVPPICEALEYAHDHGVVHRDIKPENVLLDKEGRVKITDFGIAKILGGGGDAEEAIVGTPRYMAPEQAEHPAAVDHRADIYSLGVLFYEMLTGELPGDKIQPPSLKVRLDVRLDEIVLRALDRSPELRFQTATEFRTLVETVAVQAPPMPPTPPAAPKVKTQGHPVAAILLIIAGFLVPLIILWVVKERSSSQRRANVEYVTSLSRQMELMEIQRAQWQEKIEETSRQLETAEVAARPGLEAGLQRLQVEAQKTAKDTAELKTRYALANEQFRSGGVPVMGLLTIPLLFVTGVTGTVLGWQHLARGRYASRRKSSHTFMASIAAIFWPTLLISAVFLIPYLMVAWQQANPLTPGARTPSVFPAWLPLLSCGLVGSSLLAATWHWANPKEPIVPSNNPWPWRIFWIVLALLILPVLLCILPMFLSVAAYRDTAVRPVKLETVVPLDSPLWKRDSVLVKGANSTAYCVHGQGQALYVVYYAGSFDLPVKSFVDADLCLIRTEQQRVYQVQRYLNHPDEVTVNEYIFKLTQGRVLVLERDGVTQRNLYVAPVTTVADLENLEKLLETAPIIGAPKPVQP